MELSAAAAPYVPSEGVTVVELAAATEHLGVRSVETPKLRRRTSGTLADETPTKAARAAVQLRQLLDFYFEPFNLQHNRYLLDLVARRLGPPPQPGPWPAECLAEFRFGFDDLMGLGRIASALAKLKLAQCEALGPLRHLIWSGEGRLQLRSPPELRSFVPAADATAEASASAARYLAAVREQRGNAPAAVLSVLSYAAAEALPQRLVQVKRQLLLHRADVICLHGLEPSPSAGLAAALAEEGYSCAWGVAGVLLWDSTRLEPLLREEAGAALAVDLRPREHGAPTCRVVLMQAQVPTSTGCGGLERLFAQRPIVACVDFTLLGGAESSALVEELAELRSLPREVLGEEIAAPLAAQGKLEPLRAPASGLNRLHYPDSMLYQGLTPLLALSGHSESHLATMAPEDVVQRFPALRMPIVAAFQLAAAEPTPPSQCMGRSG